MFIPVDFINKKRGLLQATDYEVSFEDADFTERLRKRFYYGKTPSMDRPSLAVTELTVGFLTDAAPRELGRLDLSLASDMSREACISPCSMMLGLIYVDRLKHRNPEYLQQVSSSDLFLISMMMASKYLYDEGIDEEVFNDGWAESADMDVEDVNTLECGFLKAIDWLLYVRQTEFFDLLQRIERRVARDKGRERGFYSYSDLDVLCADERVMQALAEVLRQVIKVVAVCSVTYVAGVLTMLASSTCLAYLQQTLPAITPVSTLAALNVTTVTTNESLSAALSASVLFTFAVMSETVAQLTNAATQVEAATTMTSTAPSVLSDHVDMVIGEENAEPNVVCTCGCCQGSGDWLKHCFNVSGERDSATEWRQRIGQGYGKEACNWSTKCCCQRLHRPWTCGRFGTNPRTDLPFDNLLLHSVGMVTDAIVVG